ncbi:unnamed protein product [Pedinophyceae sp. YPF-701]|nr:unnamed protein product [Pedinophyceae sp. YPF-701]
MAGRGARGASRGTEAQGAALQRALGLLCGRLAAVGASTATPEVLVAAHRGVRAAGEGLWRVLHDVSLARLAGFPQHDPKALARFWANAELEGYVGVPYAAKQVAAHYVNAWGYPGPRISPGPPPEDDDGAAASPRAAETAAPSTPQELLAALIFLVDLAGLLGTGPALYDPVSSASEPLPPWPCTLETTPAALSAALDAAEDADRFAQQCRAPVDASDWAGVEALAHRAIFLHTRTRAAMSALGAAVACRATRIAEVAEATAHGRHMTPYELHVTLSRGSAERHQAALEAATATLSAAAAREEAAAVLNAWAAAGLGATGRDLARCARDAVSARGGGVGGVIGAAEAAARIAALEDRCEALLQEAALDDSGTVADTVPPLSAFLRAAAAVRRLPRDPVPMDAPCGAEDADVAALPADVQRCITGALAARGAASDGAAAAQKERRVVRYTVGQVPGGGVPLEGGERPWAVSHEEGATAALRVRDEVTAASRELAAARAALTRRVEEIARTIGTDVRFVGVR